MAEQRFEDNRIIVTTKLVDEGLLITWENTNPHTFTKRVYNTPPGGIGRLAGNVKGYCKGKGGRARLIIDTKEQKGRMVHPNDELANNKGSYRFSAPRIVEVTSTSMVTNSTGLEVKLDEYLAALQKQQNTQEPELLPDAMSESIELHLLMERGRQLQYIAESNCTPEELLSYKLETIHDEEKFFDTIRTSKGISTATKHYSPDELISMVKDLVYRHRNPRPRMFRQAIVPTEEEWCKLPDEAGFSMWTSVLFRYGGKGRRLLRSTIETEPVFFGLLRGVEKELPRYVLVEETETVEKVSIQFDVDLPKKKDKVEKRKKPEIEEIHPDVKKVQEEAQFRSQIREAMRRDLSELAARTDLTNEEKDIEKKRMESDYKLLIAKRDGMV